jgi:hypothetical protein
MGLELVVEEGDMTYVMKVEEGDPEGELKGQNPAGARLVDKLLRCGEPP